MARCGTPLPSRPDAQQLRPSSCPAATGCCPAILVGTHARARATQPKQLPANPPAAIQQVSVQVGSYRFLDIGQIRADIETSWSFGWA